MEQALQTLYEEFKAQQKEKYVIVGCDEAIFECAYWFLLPRIYAGLMITLDEHGALKKRWREKRGHV